MNTRQVPMRESALSAYRSSMALIVRSWSSHQPVDKVRRGRRGATHRVYVDLSRQAIKDSPEWKPDAGVSREYEAQLHDYYGRPVYWDNAVRAAGAPSQKQVETHPR